MCHLLFCHRLTNVTLESAYYVSGTKSNMAHSVEVCNCPAEYNGTSCQNPAQGFYRYKERTEDSAERQLIDFVGEAKRCECNGRSEMCDMETGECLACRHNSGGAHCERCSEGYYGDPNYEDGCVACPCPETNRNFARGCTVLNRRVQCICRVGYAGALCDRCASGFWGQPIGDTGNGVITLATASAMGRCAACDCDPDGTEDDAPDDDGCDRISGQCRCKPGLTGRRCDRCDQSRSTLQDGVCRVCDNCTLTLLDRTDELSGMLRSGRAHIDPNAIPAPWSKLLAYENETAVVNGRFLEATRAAFDLRNYDVGMLSALESRAGQHGERQSKLDVRIADHQYIRTDSLLSDLMAELEIARHSNEDVTQTIDKLNAYGLHTHHVNLPAAAHEAQLILDDLRQQKSNADADAAALECARTDFARWQHDESMLRNQMDEVDSLRYNASGVHRRLQDAAALAARTTGLTASARATHESNERHFEMLLDHELLIRKLKDEVLEAMNNSLVAQMDVLTEEYADGASQIQTDVATIRQLGSLLVGAVEEEAIALGDLRADVVMDADQHAAVLGRRADEYAKLFVNSRNGAELAMRASSAHTTIVEAIEAAKLAGEQAVDAVTKSHAELHESGADDASIIDRGMMSMRQSSEIEAAAEQEFRKLDGEWDVLYAETYFQDN